jgi:hypothetical protein
MTRFINRIISSTLALVLMVCGIVVSFSTQLVYAQESQVERYTVLLLDMGGTLDFTGKTFTYTADSAYDYVIPAAIKFVENIVNANGNNQIAVVTYNGSSNVVSEFTSDYDILS